MHFLILETLFPVIRWDSFRINNTLITFSFYHSYTLLICIKTRVDSKVHILQRRRDAFFKTGDELLRTDDVYFFKINAENETHLLHKDRQSSKLPFN